MAWDVVDAGDENVGNGLRMGRNLLNVAEFVTSEMTQQCSIPMAAHVNKFRTEKFIVVFSILRIAPDSPLEVEKKPYAPLRLLIIRKIIPGRRIFGRSYDDGFVSHLSLHLTVPMS